MAKLRMKAVKRSSAEMDQVIAGILVRNGVPDWEYSFGKYSEQCQCLIQENDVWLVCFVERGKKRGCKEFTTQKEAAREMICRLARTEECREKMLSELEEQWKPMKLVARIDKTTEHREWIKPVAAHIFDQKEELVASVDVKDLTVGQSQEIQDKLLKVRLQELNMRFRAAEDGAAKRGGRKSLSRLGSKKTLLKSKDEMKKQDLHRDLPGMGWKK